MTEQFSVLKPSAFTAPNNFRWAKILSSHDGDTVHAELNIGVPGTPLMFGSDICGDNRFRLAGINSPEMPTTAGKKAQRYLAHLCRSLGCFEQCVLEILGRDNYGRPVATIWSADGKVNLNQQMVESGNAVILKS